MKILRISKPETFEKYYKDIKGLTKYHIRKSKTHDTADGIMQTFKEGLNRVDKLNGVILDGEKVTGFFMSRLDTTFFANLDSQEKQPTMFIEHLYYPNSDVGNVYKGIRDKMRKDYGAKNMFIFTHRSPEAWIRFGEGVGVHFDIYGYILVDKEE